MAMKLHIIYAIKDLIFKEDLMEEYEAPRAGVIVAWDKGGEKII